MKKLIIGIAISACLIGYAQAKRRPLKTYPFAGLPERREEEQVHRAIQKVIYG